jgi:glycosyltransferase involved in cell wall biosynthesis
VRIAIVVHGRFFAFDLARELIAQGHDITVFTNYPKWAVRRFGIPDANTVSFWPHGVAGRAWGCLHAALKVPSAEALLHVWFGRWAARQVAKTRFDAVYCFSGVAEEVFQALAGSKTLRLLARCSTHIETQFEILRDERVRSGVCVECPSPWIRAREAREYALADRIVALSRFAYDSLYSRGIAESRLMLLPLGADVSHFHLSDEAMGERCARISRGEPLRVLYTGTLSYRKGLLDLYDIARTADGNRFAFRAVGPIAPEARNMINGLRTCVTLVPKQPERSLRVSYSWADLYLFPTLEDGFPAVLTQAQACALPILTTPNSAGPDIIEDGVSGWILPARNPEAFIDRLRWCDANRSRVVEMVRHLHRTHRVRDWSQVASDFADQVSKCLV